LKQEKAKLTIIGISCLVCM